MKEPELKGHQIMNEVRDLSEVLTTLPRLQDLGKVSGPSLSPVPPLICRKLHPKLLLLCLTHSPGAAHENTGDRVSRGLLRTAKHESGDVTHSFIQPTAERWHARCERLVEARESWAHCFINPHPCKGKSLSL